MTGIKLKIIANYICFTFVLLSVFANASEDEKQCKYLTATANNEYAPYSYKENINSDELKGAVKFLLDELANRLGITIYFKGNGSWAKAQHKVELGDIDMMAGIFYTGFRSQYMEYIYPPVYHSDSVLIKRKDFDFSYQTIKDLIGYRGVTVINNSLGEDFDEYSVGHLKISYVPSLNQALFMLVRRRADYLAYEKQPAMAYAQALNYSEELEVIPESLASNPLYFALSVKSKCNTIKFRRKLSIALYQMLNEGVMEKALRQGINEWQTYHVTP